MCINLVYTKNVVNVNMNNFGLEMHFHRNNVDQLYTQSTTEMFVLRIH